MERNTLEVKKNSRRIKINQSPGTFQETPEWCPWGILDASVWMRLARARYSSHVQSRVVVRHSDDKIEQAAVHCEVPAHFNPRHDNSLDNSSCPFSTLSLSSLSLPFSLLPFPQPFLQFLVHLAFRRLPRGVRTACPIPSPPSIPAQSMTNRSKEITQHWSGGLLCTFAYQSSCSNRQPITPSLSVEFFEKPQCWNSWLCQT